MSNGRFLKSDESFLEKISMGAIGTRYVYDDLKKQGHEPVELERSSMSFKIWKNIKIKRVRVPDILCVNCGIRIESRAKKKPRLEISMSHSVSDSERGWNSGLQDSDYVALVRCGKIGDEPIDWQAYPPVQYVAVSELRNAYRSGNVIQVKPKGAEEGYESRITWPASVASSDGIIYSVSEGRLQFERSQDNMRITLKLVRKGMNLDPLVRVGDKIQEGQILASVVPVEKELLCRKNKDISYYLAQLGSMSLSDRYASIKAISLLNVENAKDALKNRIVDHSEHIYVRLEAAATLMRIGDEEGIQFMRQMVNDEYLPNRLEAIIILGEIKSRISLETLRNTLFDNEQNPEIRAAAAWSMGELESPEVIEFLIQAFDEVDELIKIEAARALAKLAGENTPRLIDEFKKTTTMRRPGVAWALGHRGEFTIQDLLSCLVDDDARQWVAYVIGSKDQSNYIKQIEQLKERDPQVYFAVTVLWKILSSWVYNLKEY